MITAKAISPIIAKVIFEVNNKGVKTIIEQNPLEILEVIENVEPKTEQSTEENKPKKKAKAKKQSKNNNKVLKDS